MSKESNMENTIEISNGIKESQYRQKQIFNQIEKKKNFREAPSLEKLVHFQNAKNTPVQRWYPYREGYSRELIDIFIKEFNITHGVFDPFSGSGTTLLSSRLSGIDSVGIDINPISIEVSKAENESYNKSDLELLSVIIKEIDDLKLENKSVVIKFDLADKVFNNVILDGLLQLREFIKTIDNVRIQRLVFVAWLSIIEEVSNVKKEGNGIKYKNRKRTSSGYIKIDKDVWEQDNFPQDKFRYLQDKLLRILRVIEHDILNNYGSTEKKPEIIQGDCLEMDSLITKDLQMTFFSPPYCNCFDYFEIHKVELWLGEFVKSKEDLRRYRSSGFRSNTSSVNNKPIAYRNDYVEQLIGLFDFNKLWSKKIPDVVRGYFDDMNTLLRKLYNNTEKGGLVNIVVGNSAYTGVIVPTDVIIAEIAQENGFILESIQVVRHLTTSSQQKIQLNGLKNYLRESIVILRK